ncbi:MAG TPA: CoA-binding protein [Terriglobia bacterium]|nr:CoA-binding protein [Terriglobia bacterium]
MATTTRSEIDDFLAQKRLAMVGVSKDPKDFSRGLFRDLRRRGYDMVPVNPGIAEVEGARCFPRLQDVTPPVDGALVMTPAAKSEQVARDCAEAGIARVWLHRGVGTGAVSQAAVDFCQQRGMHLVAGFCPYMFLPETEFFHRLHGVFMRLTGGYPTYC